MPRFALRHLIATCAIAVTLTLTLLSGAARATNWQGTRFLQVYSMVHLDDARARAWRLKNQGFGDTAIFKASNGLYAITVGKVPHGAEHVVHDLKACRKIPQDAFLTSGRHYVAQINLHAPAHGHDHLSGYAPGHVHKVQPRPHSGHKKVITYYY